MGSFPVIMEHATKPDCLHPWTHLTPFGTSLDFEEHHATLPQESIENLEVNNRQGMKFN